MTDTDDLDRVIRASWPREHAVMEPSMTDPLHWLQSDRALQAPPQRRIVTLGDPYRPTEAPRPNACGGDCNQGRRCDCAPAPAEAATSVGHDDDDDDTAHRSRRIPEGAAIVTIPMLWLVLLGVLLGVHLWRGLA